jgi:hypothetical protein
MSAQMAEVDPVENEFKCVRLAAAKLDLKIKEDEIARKPSYFLSLLAQPPVLATLIAGLITAAGGVMTRLSAEYSTQIESEKAKNAELIEAEKLRNAEKLEHLKYEGELIVEAMRAGDTNKKAENIEFLVQSGLLQDPPLEEKLNNYLKAHPPKAKSTAVAQPK